MDTIFSYLPSDFDLSNLYTLRIFSLHPELYILAALLMVLIFFVFLLTALVQNLREQIEYLNEEHEKEKSEMVREAEEQLREIEEEVEKEIKMGLDGELKKELEEIVKRCVIQCLDQYFAEKEKRENEENEELLKKYLNSEEGEGEEEKGENDEENDEDAPWNEEDAMEEGSFHRKKTDNKEDTEEEVDDDEIPWNEEDAMEEDNFSVRIYENIKKEFKNRTVETLFDKYNKLPEGKVLDVSDCKNISVMNLADIEKGKVEKNKVQVPGLRLVSDNRSNLRKALKKLGYTYLHVQDWLELWDNAFVSKEESVENSREEESKEESVENSEESEEESEEESSGDHYDEEHPSDDDFDSVDLKERLESLKGLRKKDKDVKEEVASLNEYLGMDADY